MKTTAEVMTLAQDLLAHRYGGTQRLSDVSRLAGSGSAQVFRVKIAPQPFFQHRTAIVKYIPATGDPLDDAALGREVAAYQFTTSLAEETRPGPMLLAHDISRRLIILSDSGEGDTFSELLQSTDRMVRQEILRNLGTALGRVHVGTADKEADFTILLNRMFKAHPEAAEGRDVRDRSLGPTIVSGMKLIAQAGVPVPEILAKRGKDAARRLNSGQSRAFTPFDLSPDNIIVAQRTEFLDYEWAGFRDITFDLACVIGGFPQSLNDRLISDVEAEVFLKAWVAEAKHLWPSITSEDYLHGRITDALIGWACSSVAMMHYGSLANALTAIDQADDKEVLQNQDIVPVPVPLLRTRSQAARYPLSEEERLIRRDLFETFDSLSRYAAQGCSAGDDVISAFARTVADRVADA